jgi:hypothetical protein
MSHPISSPLAPKWVCCIGCLGALVPLPTVVFLIAVGYTAPWTVVLLPYLGYIYLSGLNTLITGRPSKSLFSLVAEWRSGVRMREDRRSG